MTNYIITIDPSINSTAMVINGKNFSFCESSYALTKNGKLTKWYQIASDVIKYVFLDYPYKNIENYSERELQKVYDFENTCNKIINEINKEVKKDNILPDIKIYIEGYAYKTGDDNSLIDLVTFSTLLRDKLIKNFGKENIKIISPKELKLNSCKMTYPPVNEGKRVDKWVYKNTIGMSGGSFTKREICISLMDNENERFMEDKYVSHLKTNRDLILNNKEIKKPYEDSNDAYTMYMCAKLSLL